MPVLNPWAYLAMWVIKAPTKASLQGGSLLISTISPSPVSKVYGVFNNMVLPSSSGEKQQQKQ